MRSWEGTQSGQLMPTDPRHVSDNTVPCSAVRAVGKEKEWGKFKATFVFSCSHYTG